MIKQMVKKILLYFGIIKRPQIILNGTYEGNYRDTYQGRIQKVLDCPDNKYIPRVKDAGKIFDNYQIMHNGLKITRGSYYPDLIETMLLKNKGVHEPQEERMFAKILKKIPANSTMIELGSYWAFYSMWFNKEIVGANTYMVEPDKEFLDYGKKNYKLNNMNGTFIHSKIGVGFLNVDDIVKKYNITKINILHSDIQGFELEMLNGCKESISNNIIDYIFVSTHSQQLHIDCIKYLKTHGFNILYSADFDNDTYSYDGIIVGKYKGLKND